MERLKAEVEDWALEASQEHVTIEITKQFFLLGGSDSVRLHPIESDGDADWRSINNNRQKIFRWLRSDSRASRVKVEALKPAIIAALPAERRAHINGDQHDYLVSVLLRDISKALISIVLKDVEMVERIGRVQNSFDAILRNVTNHR
ncbi:MULTISPECIES: toxin YdaT family protein [Dickeya]|uniref:toxin YdaT family protein n=1 Tax=Dickeya TaxID=204037 RepID=UPI00039D2707|nr:MULTISPECIES: toxin YdaT family protein [Dickeya]